MQQAPSFSGARCSLTHLIGIGAGRVEGRTRESSHSSVECVANDGSQTGITLKRLSKPCNLDQQVHIVSFARQAIRSLLGQVATGRRALQVMGLLQAQPQREE